MTLGVRRGGKKEEAFRKRALPSVAPRDEDLVPPMVGLGPLEQGTDHQRPIISDT